MVNLTTPHANKTSEGKRKSLKSGTKWVVHSSTLCGPLYLDN